MKEMIKLSMVLALTAVLGTTGCQQISQNRSYTDESYASTTGSSHLRTKGTSQQTSQHRPRNEGTSQQTSQHRPVTEAPAPAPAAKPAPAPAPAPKVGCSDPTWGLIRMTKTMPPEVSLGGEFVADLSLTAQNCAANVVVKDKVPASATYVRSEPAATVEGDQLTWNIGDMDAGQTINAKVWFKATKEGTIVNCATVSADPRVCVDQPAWSTPPFH